MDKARLESLTAEETHENSENSSIQTGDEYVVQCMKRHFCSQR